jgi:hypothetical protein
MIPPPPTTYPNLPWYVRARCCAADYTLAILVIPFYWGHLLWARLRKAADTHYLDEDTDDTNV